ncbi:MAG: hypothetical protein KAH25_00210, partial [Bacteroidales bacterium]|nr:hypothetical protein [Bacteroidales bacterium]
NYQLIDGIPVITVKGSPFEMGEQIGTLLKTQVNECLPTFLAISQKNDPETYSNDNLDDAWQKMRPYIHNDFVAELKGLALGSGVDFDLLRRAHMVPVISDYACSGVAVWGDATSQGDLFHIRNLDFTKNAHLQDYPAVVIYIPENGIASIHATFAGYIASHSGMNAKGIVLGEKGESPSSDAPFDYDGIHFSLLFRDILNRATTLEEAINGIQQAKLIKRYYLFASDGQEETMGAAKFLVSSPDKIKLRMWKDNDLNDTLVPGTLPNAIYYSVDNNTTFELLKKYNGQFDSEKAIELSKAIARKNGNLLNVVYNPSRLEIWVAYANGSKDALEQDYSLIKMKDFIN